MGGELVDKLYNNTFYDQDTFSSVPLLRTALFAALIDLLLQANPRIFENSKAFMSLRDDIILNLSHLMLEFSKFGRCNLSTSIKEDNYRSFYGLPGWRLALDIQSLFVSVP